MLLEGDLPRRDDIGVVYDELDYQMATQAYLWALPLVAYAQWQQVHRDVFGASNFDIVHYITYQDRLGLITANATTPFWSATVYTADTRCLVDNEQGRGDRGPRDGDLVTNGDGSVDLYFGPTAPAGKESNWVQTIPGQHWFSYFRLYGPLEAYVDRSWKLGDLTRL